MRTDGFDDLDEVLDRLFFVAMELGRLHRELAMVMVAEQEAKAEGWRESTSNTVTGAKQEASLMALDFTKDVIRLKGDIAAYEAEREYLGLLVNVLGGSDGRQRA